MFRFTPDEAGLFDKLYAYDADTGRRLFRRVLKGMPKGNGKSEFAAVVGNTELYYRPFNQVPDIPVGAASYEQADLVFGAMKTMMREGPLAPYIEAFDTEMYVKDKPGRAYRVAAAAGTNDGGRRLTGASNHCVFALVSRA